MANAGCINAYDCNGCLIQTLQNLDSACIGVGVQYTAPNPLDDKRLDYIKYTDKCGCVQCLSAENEILIYATDGVIKNLTLTNDDVNEAIKIQWNDIFGSNRAKTIVRYKTGSAPVSITDGTLAVEETVKNQYSSTPFSLTGVLDETTYYITAFAVDSNNTVISSQTASVTTDFGWHPSANTLAYFPLKGNYNNESGKTVTTTISGSGLSFATDSVLNLQYLNATRQGWFYTSDLGTLGNITLSAWCKPNWNNSGWMELFAVGYKADSKTHIWGGISGGTNAGKWVFSFSSASTDMISNLQQTNARHHIVIEYNPTTHYGSLYIDGVKLISTTFTDYGTIYNNVLVIAGRYRTNYDESWAGGISEVIYEDVIWSDADVLNYYNKTKSQYGY